MAARTTDRYFLSKLRAEAALFESGLEVLVFRPSYIVGPRDGLVSSLLRQMAAGEVEQVGDGTYRMQPIAVRDAAAAVVAGIGGPTPAPAPGRGPHRVIDLVGPQAITFHDFVDALAAPRASGGGPPSSACARSPWRRRTAGRARARECRRKSWTASSATRSGDARPLEALLGRFLTPLDEALDAAVRGTPPEKRSSASPPPERPQARTCPACARPGSPPPPPAPPAGRAWAGGSGIPPAAPARDRPCGRTR